MRTALALMLMIIINNATSAAVLCTPQGVYSGWWIDATASAYSPQDARDAAYAATKGRDRWKTAASVDVRLEPYGIAAPFTRDKHRTPLWVAYGTRVYVPAGQGYLDQTRADDRIFKVDDTGADITNFTLERNKLHIDLRYMTEDYALKFGVKEVRVFVIEEEITQPILTELDHASNNSGTARN